MRSIHPPLARDAPAGNLARRLYLSFVIPLFNCLPLTRACVASLQATIPPTLAHEIILVDDGSSDGTREWLATLTSPPFRVVLNERNLGYAGANHRGASVASGEFLVLLNSDLVLTSGWLEPMLAATRLPGKPGIIGNVQRNLRTGALDHTGIFINAKGKPQHDRESVFFSRFKNVVAVTGACLLLRRDLWEKLGGFDTAFVNGCEDVDLCLKAHRAGYAVVVALRSVIDHHISASPGRKRHDEANTFKLTLRWRDELAALGLHAWCRDYLERVWNGTSGNPDFLSAVAVLAYLLHLRREPPSIAIDSMEEAIEIELTRWKALLS